VVSTGRLTARFLEHDSSTPSEGVAAEESRAVLRPVRRARRAPLRASKDITMTATDQYLQNNEAYAASFSGPLPLPPARHTAVVACMDARLNPYGVLGLSEGDSHVIRNAGGVVTDDTIRSLAISQHLLGTEEIVLIHHTDCGMLTFTDEQFAGILESETGERPTWEARSFGDLEGDVRDSIARITASPFVKRKDSVRGFVFDVATGRLREVS